MEDVDTVHMSGFISLLYTQLFSPQPSKLREEKSPTEVLPSVHQLPVNKPLIKANQTEKVTEQEKEIQH